jgi:hypothetical protein
MEEIIIYFDCFHLNHELINWKWFKLRRDPNNSWLNVCQLCGNMSLREKKLTKMFSIFSMTSWTFAIKRRDVEIETGFFIGISF